MAVTDFVMSFTRSTIAAPRLRPYGAEVIDLEIDFDAPRWHVATRVLAACLGCDEAAIRALTVQKRILLLLGISELSLADPVEAHLACTCGETAIVELGTQDLAEFAAARSRDEIVVSAVTLRLPTGEDQVRWARLDAPHSARAVLDDLVVSGELSDELVARADALLSEVDPLIELEVESACPRCGAALSRHVDIELMALTRLRNARRILLEQVHALAATYHWTEAAIAALPSWRRAEYAALAITRWK
jgi:hypothetical protein